MHAVAAADAARKPGVLSEELRTALGMGDNSPPPWLINMQRYGPPPSYPDLKVRPTGTLLLLRAVDLSD